MSLGPIAGAALAVVCGFVLRGPGGGKAGSGAAQGDLFTEVARSRQGLNTVRAACTPSGPCAR